MRRPTELIVVGGGLAGLIAATEAAEAGASVRLLEARSRLGGRAGSSPAPFVANLGPHALYTGTELWDWLVARDLHGPARAPRSAHITFRWQGRVRRTPPRALLRALGIGLGRGAAPIDVDLRTWARGRWDGDTADALSGLAGVLTFDHDPGRLSAAFVVERMRRILLRPASPARYVEDGWASLVGRIGSRARDLGVAIELSTAIDGSDLRALRDQGPVILAVEPGAARRLGLDATPALPPRKVALLDVGVDRARDPYLVLDLDEAIFSTRPSAVIDSVAPEGSDVVQLSGGMAPGEALDDAEARLEGVLDAAAPH